MLDRALAFVASLFKPKPVAANSNWPNDPWSVWRVQPYEGPGLVDMPAGRPFGASGDVPGSMTESPVALPIAAVPGVPGGTLYNGAKRPVPAAVMAPLPGGTNTRVSQGYGDALAAQAMRGHGYGGRTAETSFVHSTVASSGSAARVPVTQAITAIDRRNPTVAPYVQPPMASGSTRIVGASAPAPTQQTFAQGGASVPVYAIPRTSVQFPFALTAPSLPTGRATF